MLLHSKPYGVRAPLEDLASIPISERYRSINKVVNKGQCLWDQF